MIETAREIAPSLPFAPAGNLPWITNLQTNQKKWEGFVFSMSRSCLLCLSECKLTQLSSKHLYGDFSTLKVKYLEPSPNYGSRNCRNWKYGYEAGDRTVFSSIMLLRKPTVWDPHAGSLVTSTGGNIRGKTPTHLKEGHPCYFIIFWEDFLTPDSHSLARKKNWWLELENTRKQRGYVFGPAMAFDAT